MLLFWVFLSVFVMYFIKCFILLFECDSMEHFLSLNCEMKT